MNKTEFLKDLDKRLKYIPAEDRSDALEYYEEYLGELGIGDQDDVFGVIESPKEIAGKIIEECTEKHINEQQESKSMKGSAIIVWLTILGVLSLPLSLPLAIIAVIFIICILIGVGALLIAIFGTGLAFVVAGLGCLFAAFFAGSMGQTLLVLGMGFLGIAIGIVSVLIGLGVIRLVAFICSKLFGKKKGNKRNE